MFLAPAIAAASSATAAIGGIGTAVSLASAGLGAIGSIQQTRYQSAVLGRQAEAANVAAADRSLTGQIQQQEQDQEAAIQLGAMTASAGASGFAVNSGSFRRQQAISRQLARRDALRIRNDADREVQNLQTQAADAKIEDRWNKRAGMFNLLGAGLDMGSTLVTGATRVRKSKADQITRDSRNI